MYVEDIEDIEIRSIPKISGDQIKLERLARLLYKAGTRWVRHDSFWGATFVTPRVNLYYGVDRVDWGARGGGY